MFKPFEILDMAIRLENNAEALYRSKAGDLEDPESRRWMVRLAEEEKKHARWFADLKNRLQTGEEDALLREMSAELLGDFLGKASFSLEDADFSKIRTSGDLAKLSVEFEQDTILFYELLQSFITDEETLDTLRIIIGEEKEHINKFKEWIGKENP